VARVIVVLVSVLTAALVGGPAAAKPSKFVERLRAAAEPEEEVEPADPDEGTDEPEEAPAEPYSGEGEYGEEEGGGLPPPRALPDPEEIPPVEPATGKPLERGPAQPERAQPPAGPVE
jgi:hypothetical protein